MPAVGTDNNNNNNNNSNNNNNNRNSSTINFTIKDTKLFVPVVTLWARDNQKSSKVLSKWFEISFY